MKLGCDVPYLSDPGAIRAFAQVAEELGYDHIGFSEHVATTTDTVFPPRMSFDEPWHESFTMLGFLAGCTSRIELMSSMTLLALRPVVLAAKQAAEIDLLSRGRLRLGVSVSWNPREFVALGVDPSSRGTRIEEQVEVLRQLWSRSDVTYHGAHVHLDGVAIVPRPGRVIPIWMGAGSMKNGGIPSEHVLRRIGRLADGYKMFAPLGEHPEVACDLAERVRGYAVDAGRKASDVGFEARLVTHATPADAWADCADFWVQAGATHLGLANRALRTGVDEQIPLLSEAMQRIGPRIAATRVPHQPGETGLGRPDTPRDHIHGEDSP